MNCRSHRWGHCQIESDPIKGIPMINSNIHNSLSVKGNHWSLSTTVDVTEGHRFDCLHWRFPVVKVHLEEVGMV
ncbi:hypothetical protein WICPIJ_002210 [Wickerhamomyces pijperi]|uniref:Uncharacterized protein n=1 Tax=Wickerhamomyces pijperi TaxID=599730 RepID=A0A9P8Q9J4_WICPI|nr:hypothetical protein WICPIJ_002210 [Wickerhamomyces pijperi]